MLLTACRRIRLDHGHDRTVQPPVCGPFSVESLSPHRVLSTADENQDSTVTEQEAREQQDFATMISWGRLQESAKSSSGFILVDANGKTRRVAVSIE